MVFKWCFSTGLFNENDQQEYDKQLLYKNNPLSFGEFKVKL